MKIQITIRYPWDENGPTDIQEIKERMEGWSGAEWAGEVDKAEIKIIENGLYLY